jgi:hypothetical protein
LFTFKNADDLSTSYFVNPRRISQTAKLGNIFPTDNRQGSSNNQGIGTAPDDITIHHLSSRWLVAVVQERQERCKFFGDRLYHPPPLKDQSQKPCLPVT